MRATASLVTILLACTGGTVAPPPPQKPTPPVVKPLPPPPDPDAPLVPLGANIKTGKLKNGLTYFIVDNEEYSFDETLVTLAVNAGSLDETDQQKGAAHLLLHLMQQFVDEDYSDAEDLGQTFYTRTRVTLATDDTEISEDSEMERKLGLLRRMADGMRIDRAKVDLARTDIHEYGSDDEFEDIWTGTKRETHPPFGEAEHFEALTEKEVAEFYRTWYRPDNMAIIVTGNVDVPGVAKRIEKRFGNMVVPTTPRPGHPKVDVPAQAGMKVEISSGGSTFDVYHRIPQQRTRGEKGYRADLIDRYLQEKIAERYRQTTPRSSVDSSFIELGTGVDVSRMSVRANDVDDIRRFIREIERLKVHGIEADDLAAQQEMYAEEAQEDPYDDGLADVTDKLAVYFDDGTPVPSRELSATTARLFGAITVDEVNAVLRTTYGDANRTLTVDAIEPGLTEQRVRQLVAAATTTPPEPWDQRPSRKPLIPTPPAAGTVTSLKEDRGMTIMTLSNGARLILRITTRTSRNSLPSEVVSDNYARLYAIGQGGWARGTVEQAINARFAGDILLRSGVGDLPYDQFKDVMREQEVNLYADIRQMNHELSVTAAPYRLDQMFQVMHLALTKPRKDPAAFAAWKKTKLESLKATANNPYLDVLEQLRALEGNRPTPFVIEQDLDLLDPDKALAAYQDHVGDIKGTTFLVVGNVDASRVKDLAEKFLANIPAMGTRVTAKPRAVPRPKLPKSQVLSRPGAEHSLVLDYIGDVATGDRLQAERDLGLYGWALQNRLDQKFQRPSYASVTAAIADDGHRYVRVTLSSRLAFPATAEKDVQTEVDKLKTTVDQVVLDALNSRYMPRPVFGATWAMEMAAAIGRGEDVLKRAAFLIDRDGAVARIKPDLVKATAKKFGKPAATVTITPAPTP